MRPYKGPSMPLSFHPLLCFTFEADCLGVRLRNGNVHSAEGALHARKWHVHVSTAFHVAHHYHEVFNSG